MKNVRWHKTVCVCAYPDRDVWSDSRWDGRRELSAAGWVCLSAERDILCTRTTLQVNLKTHAHTAPIWTALFLNTSIPFDIMFRFFVSVHGLNFCVSACVLTQSAGHADTGTGSSSTQEVRRWSMDAWEGQLRRGHFCLISVTYSSYLNIKYIRNWLD